jgi:hypothetical protein
MGDFIASTFVAAAGNNTIANAREYLGLLLQAGADAATVKVYKGSSAVAANLIASLSAGIGLAAQDAPSWVVDIDVPTPTSPAFPGRQPATSGLFVVVTGTAPDVLVRYST